MTRSSSHKVRLTNWLSAIFGSCSTLIARATEEGSKWPRLVTAQRNQLSLCENTIFLDAGDALGVETLGLLSLAVGLVAGAVESSLVLSGLEASTVSSCAFAFPPLPWPRPRFLPFPLPPRPRFLRLLLVLLSFAGVSVIVMHSNGLP